MYPPLIYQIKITLQYIDPAIWRRVLVASDTTLARFHDILQAVMGWTNSHLHVFRVGDVHFTYPYEPGDLEEMTAIDTRYVKLAHIIPRRSGFKFEYEYDLGDSWKHELLVEETLSPDPAKKLPVCIGGERASPPEDVGGALRYARFLEALGDRKHPDHAMYREWLGRKFDPEAFQMEPINKKLAKLKPGK